MTDRELIQQALEALDGVEALLTSMDVTHLLIYGDVDNAIAALRERLAQPVQERVWIQPNHLQKARQAPFLCRVEPAKRDDFVPLYTTPPQREWVGLTADEIWKCNKAKSGSAVEFHICYEHQNVLDFAEAIEAKIKEKNGG